MLPLGALFPRVPPPPLSLNCLTIFIFVALNLFVYLLILFLLPHKVSFMKARTLTVRFIFSQCVQQCWPNMGHPYLSDERIDWMVKGTGAF